jgi:hypothetical protein
MANGFTKLHSGILGSTIWRESPSVKVVWITLLALADQDGIVEGTVPGLAAFSNVSLEDTEAAIEKFLSPDKYSRTPDCEGRRIEVIEGGWRLLNYEKYREKLSQEDLKEKARLRQQRHRDRVACHEKRDTAVTECDGHGKSRMSRQAEADCRGQNAEAELKPKPISSNLDLEKDAVREVFTCYLQKTARNQALYELTPKRMDKGLSRLRECLKKSVDEELPSAVAMMKLALDAMVRSDWHMGRDPKTQGKKYCEWDAHLFPSYEKMEGWWSRG